MAREPAAGELTVPGEGAVDGFAFASPEDDAELRALLQRITVPGSVEVAFTREPDYFAGEWRAGGMGHTLVHRTNGLLEGVGRLSVHTLHRNGRPSRIGYLGELRIEPGAPASARLLREGYAILRSVVENEGAEGCFTSIASDNARARRVLELGGRLGLPAYTPIADLVTVVIPSGGRAARRYARPCEDRDELTAFLARRAPAGQLTLTWHGERWDDLGPHDLGWLEFHVVREHASIVAAAAIWDQRAFRQVVVRGYARALRWSRPLVNALATVGLAPALPPPGSVLSQAAIFGACVAHERHWAPLLTVLRAHAAQRGIAYLTVARDARDPELAAIRRAVRGRRYLTRLYDVRWPDLPGWREDWDGRPFRPEVALL